MGYGGNKQGSVTRRHFLKTTSAIAGAAGLAPALSAPFVSTALAQTKTLKVIQWSHFVPQFDTWIDGFAKDWERRTASPSPSITFRTSRYRHAPRRRLRQGPGTT